MTEYDIEPPPDRLSDRVQFRTAYTVDQGEVVRFMTQLEYWLDGDWQVVVRYDHDRHAPGGHDISDEGLHLDVYRDGVKVRTERVTGPIPATDGFEAAKRIYERTPNATSDDSNDGTTSEGGTTGDRRRIRGVLRPDLGPFRPDPGDAPRRARIGIVRPVGVRGARYPVTPARQLSIAGMTEIT